MPFDYTSGPTTSTTITAGNFNPSDFIAKYGAEAALAKANPAIMNLLIRAVNEGWDKTKFITEFRNLKWFQDNDENYRLASAASAADPAEYKAKTKRIFDQLKLRATQLGYAFDDATLENLSKSLLSEYWTQGGLPPSDVLDQRIGSIANVAKVTGGKVMSTKDSLKSFASSMGVKFDDGWFNNAAQSMTSGSSTEEQWKQAIKDAAKSRFPMFAEQIDAGQTVDYIVSPYKQSLSSILEVPYTTISLDDPALARAFGSVSKDGKPAVMGIWDYEKSLRDDPRWAYTKNARSSIDSVARKVLQDFGLAN